MGAQWPQLPCVNVLLTVHGLGHSTWLHCFTAPSHEGSLSDVDSDILCWISLLCGHLPPHTWALASWQGSPNPYGNPLVLPLWLLPLCQAATAHHCRHLRGHSLQPTWIQTSCSTSMGKLTLLSSVEWLLVLNIQERKGRENREDK